MLKHVRMASISGAGCHAHVMAVMTAFVTGMAGSRPYWGISAQLALRTLPLLRLCSAKGCVGAIATIPQACTQHCQGCVVRPNLLARWQECKALERSLTTTVIMDGVRHGSNSAGCRIYRSRRLRALKSTPVH